MRFDFALFLFLGFVTTAEQVVTGHVKVHNGPELRVVSATYSGSGCPPGTADHVTSTDEELVSRIDLNFKKFNIQSSPNTAITKHRKFCQFMLTLQYSKSWQYTVYRADWNGHASLNDGVKGICKATSYFAGHSEQTEITTTLAGPSDEDFIRKEEADSLIWSACGKLPGLNLKTELRFDPLVTRSENKVSLGKSGQKFYLKWRRCASTTSDEL